MSLIQFESGHVVGDKSMRVLRPVFRVRKVVRLNVVAGTEALDAAEPSIFLDRTTTVLVDWECVLTPLPAARHEDAPASTRRGRTAAPEVSAPTETVIVVAQREVLLAQQSDSLVDSDEYARLADFVDPRDKDIDYQALVHRYVNNIGQLHSRVRSSASDVPDVDPMADPGTPTASEDSQAFLVERVAKLKRILSFAGATGIEDLLEGWDAEAGPDEDAAQLVLEGTVELQTVLQAHYGTALGPDDIGALLALPIVSIDGMLLDTHDHGGGSYEESAQYVPSDQRAEGGAAFTPAPSAA